MRNDDLKRRVRDANNIVDIVQSAVGKLTRAGRNYKACCPFHNEKTASFNVNVEGQFFKCFGCGKSGDVFTFVMLHERVEFLEALKILADRAGIPFENDPQAAAAYQKEKDWKSYLYKLNDVAARFFSEQLHTEGGKHALAYLGKRGLNAEICERFGLGYAPTNGPTLVAKLFAQKAPAKAVLMAGLAKEFEGGAIRDFFWDRLMFPIRDIQGRIIAFGGRILGDGEPKYLNTRDTPLFSKTKTVYGIDIARDKIEALHREESARNKAENKSEPVKKVILVEGYTDVMMCHQFGVENVVACLGTAITPEHIQQLRRVADELLILTDSDAAGEKASNRSLPILFGEMMPAKIVRLPGGEKDPCDFLLAKGREPFVEALTHTQELFDYKLERTLATRDIRTPMGHKAAADDLMALVSLVPDPILRNELRRRVSSRLNISESELKFEAPKTVNVESSITQEVAAELGITPPPETPLAHAERELLCFLFHEPAWLGEAVGKLDFLSFSGRCEKALAHALLLAISEGKLPPEPSILVDGNASSIVAREVFEKFDAVLAAGVVVPPGTFQVCADLAERVPAGNKLEAGDRFAMLVEPIHKARLEADAQAHKRDIAHARSQGDREAEERAYEKLAEVLKKLATLKNRPRQR